VGGSAWARTFEIPRALDRGIRQPPKRCAVCAEPQLAVEGDRPFGTKGAIKLRPKSSSGFATCSPCNIEAVDLLGDVANIDSRRRRAAFDDGSAMSPEIVRRDFGQQPVCQSARAASIVIGEQTLRSTPRERHARNVTV
jgi:hypothetical protein